MKTESLRSQLSPLLSLKKVLKSLLPASSRRGLRAGQRRVRQTWERHFGRYHCPVCERRVASFIPFPTSYSEQQECHGFDPSKIECETVNAAQYTCPHCGETDHNRLYALYLRERLAGVSDGFKLVDFAPSEPLRAWIKRTFRIHYRTADLFKTDVDDRVDLTDRAIYPTASFDAFICSHMLEHIRDDSKAMRELFRILKPGGWGILMVPIDLRRQEIFEDPSKALTEEDRCRYFGQSDHVRIYSRQGFLERLGSAGFRVDALSKDHFGANTLQRCGITAKSVLYVGHRDQAVR